MDKTQYYFENIIGFNSHIELRVFSKIPWEYEGKMYNFFSKFATNYQELFWYIKKYSEDSNLNLYVGINPRARCGKKIEDVTEIKNLVFDMEGHKKKSLSDTEYTGRLMSSIKWLSNKLRPYGLEFTTIVASGRGVHCYCTFEHGLALKNRHTIKHWFNMVVADFNTNGPYGTEKYTDKPDLQVKIDMQVSDPARILGVVGTQNTKYTEVSGKRKFLVFTEKFLDEKYFMKIITEKMERLSRVNPTLRDKKPSPPSTNKKYTKKSLFYSPELKLLLDYPNVPEGNRYTHIVLPIKMMMRENRLDNYQEVIAAIEANGYGAPKIDGDFPEEDEFTSYEYSTNIFRKWCFDNWKWCLDNKYILPYSYTMRPYRARNGNKLPMVQKDMLSQGLKHTAKTWDALVGAMKEFNGKNTVVEGNFVEYDYNRFAEFLMNNVSEDLQRFIKMNKLLDYLRCVR